MAWEEESDKCGDMAFEWLWQDMHSSELMMVQALG